MCLICFTNFLGRTATPIAEVKQDDCHDSHTNHDSGEFSLVFVRKKFDLLQSGWFVALSIVTRSEIRTWSSVEEILLHGITYARTEFWRSAGDLATTASAGAGVCIVSLCIGAHQGHALKIARSALPGSTC